MAVVISKLLPVKSAQYRYVDLALDLDIQRNNDQVKQNDIKILTDDRALATRLINLLMTTPGQMVLNPQYGCNLNQYLFSSVTRERGYVMGRYIQDQITSYVPEVQLTAINVVADLDRQQYNIEISYRNALLSTTDFTLIGSVNRIDSIINFA
jgi:phage baseplate assembly protein W